MLTANQIWEIIESLSKSQGFYSRLFKALENNPDKDKILESWASKGFKDAVDFILSRKSNTPWKENIFIE